MRSTRYWYLPHVFIYHLKQQQQQQQQQQTKQTDKTTTFFCSGIYNSDGMVDGIMVLMLFKKKKSIFF